MCGVYMLFAAYLALAAPAGRNPLFAARADGGASYSFSDAADIIALHVLLTYANGTESGDVSRRRSRRALQNGFSLETLAEAVDLIARTCAPPDGNACTEITHGLAVQCVLDNTQPLGELLGELLANSLIGAAMNMFSSICTAQKFDGWQTEICGSEVNSAVICQAALSTVQTAALSTVRTIPYGGNSIRQLLQAILWSH